MSESNTEQEDEQQMNDGAEQNRSRHSPAGFAAPSPELDGDDDDLIVCAVCEESGPISEMGVIKDTITKDADNAVIGVSRQYLHNNEECVNGMFKSDFMEDDQ